MDHAKISPCRHSPAGQASQVARTETLPPVDSGPRPRPASEPRAIRQRTLPVGSSGGPQPPGEGIDFGRVGKNAVASAITLGSCYGTMVAINNAVRATPGMPVPLKVLSGLLPTAGVFPTPWVEEGLRQALDTSATFPVRPTLAHDAVAGVSLFLFNATCVRSAWVPKYPPATPAGMAASFIQCTAASLLAGGASEMTAQWMNLRDLKSGDEGIFPEHIDNTRKACGRILSQVPAAALQTGVALAGKPLPPSLSLLPLGVVTGGWSLRRVLIPQEPAMPSKTPPSPATTSDLPAWAIPACDIPPA